MPVITSYSIHYTKLYDRRGDVIRTAVGFLLRCTPSPFREDRAPEAKFVHERRSANVRGWARVAFGLREIGGVSVLVVGLWIDTMTKKIV